VTPVADVDEPVARDPDAVDRIAERFDTGLTGRPAVGAPVALVGARPGVEDDHAAVAVAVGDVQLVGGGVHPALP